MVKFVIVREKEKDGMENNKNYKPYNECTQNVLHNFISSASPYKNTKLTFDRKKNRSNKIGNHSSEAENIMLLTIYKIFKEE